MTARFKSIILTAVIIVCLIFGHSFSVLWLTVYQFSCIFVGETSHETKNEAYTSEPACDSNSRPRVRTDCDKEFATECALKRHSETHSEKTYSCTECNRCFSAENYLKKHMNIHSGNHMCSECGKSFKHKRNLTIHERIHTGEKPFECSVCDKRFSQAGSLTIHNRIHVGDKPHKCSVCDKSFTSSSDLRRHERRMHSNVRPHLCSYCGKQFATVYGMKSHVRVHTGVKPFSCRHCSEEFVCNDLLKAHLLKSHDEGTWFTCHICQKKFNLKRNLMQHMQRHEGVKPFACEECPKRFCTACELKYHQLVHSDNRQFCCVLCNAQFKRKDSFKRHVKSCSAALLVWLWAVRLLSSSNTSTRSIDTSRSVLLYTLPAPFCSDYGQYVFDISWQISCVDQQCLPQRICFVYIISVENQHYSNFTVTSYVTQLNGKNHKDAIT